MTFEGEIQYILTGIKPDRRRGRGKRKRERSDVGLWLIRLSQLCLCCRMCAIVLSKDTLPGNVSALLINVFPTILLLNEVCVFYTERASIHAQ